MNNPRNQAKLAKHLDTDIENVLESLLEYDLGQWGLIAEIFRDNERILQARGLQMAARPFGMEHAPWEATKALSSLMMCDSVPITRNQEAVLKCISRSPAILSCEAVALATDQPSLSKSGAELQSFFSKAGLGRPLDLKIISQLADDSQSNSSQKHTRLTELVNLLAKACVVKSTHGGLKKGVASTMAQSKCQQLLSLEEAVASVLLDTVSHELRMTLLFFITCECLRRICTIA